MYTWSFAPIIQASDLFLWGAWITVVYTAGSIAIGLVLGLAVCFARLSGIGPLNWFAQGFQELFRCTPLLVQLLWIYYALPLLLGFDMPNWAAALLTLSLYAAAFYAEVFRGGIVSIDKGQFEAGAAIGMSGWQVMRRIILPQAIRRMMPAFINQSVTQFKNTSLVSVISVADLTYMASIVNGQTYRPLESYTVVAVLYFVILFPMMKFADYIEHRMRRGN
ncbi:amino acid ABC transporter permease [Bosea sp. (in: a-proteobacteria)]|jgi:polar amino acid transport system permease protein|uniref:amino acid ABC transporter permease n=1 Tax=Bosea sp. (in: a-proteobacteria) TaxID=1871050 RepID=UPI00086F296F|nr:amino acid ABC transporter permease [Bosea sp. (in: a-proteobacteria)]MBN9437390.1 amino acid ABC transporter permease [Bosea sp. (in: a-proteobacteria)]MBN9448187.1 amino acid ABC transporter permease [Bosea sp. (in: a-proteobacteria)]MBN9472090.1 amino acid ABC transporter permease [Bosea sp. (in: a-proteobacteria)]ODT43949.1 MAG: ABC transporter permease [Methylobacterium sp. SCN 67-24]